MKTLAVLGLAALVLGLAPRAACPQEVQREGKVRGTVITVGETSLVVQKAEGGQITLEPRWLGGGRGQDKEQIAFFRTLKQGDLIEATWKLDEGTHFCVLRIAKLGPDGVALAGDARPGGDRARETAGAGPQPQGRQPAAPNEALVRGTVVVVGEEGRVILQKADGGQITLEPRYVRVGGQGQGHPEIINFVKALKQGDTVDAFVRPGEGGHFMNWGIARPDGEMVGRMPTQPGGVWTAAAPAGAGGEGRRAESNPIDDMRALRAEIGNLRREIAAMKDLVTKLLEK